MASVKMRLLTHNILKGGEGCEAEIVEVIRAAASDVVVVPEVLGVDRFRRIAAAVGMAPRLAEGRDRIPPRVGLLSRLPILGFRTLRPWPVWPGCIEASVRHDDGLPLTVYGVHLAAYYPWFLEWWRPPGARHHSRHVRRTVPGDRHLLAGDFNAVAPGDRVPRLALKPLLDAGYVDCFRGMHPQEDGFTLPSTGPQVRLDYVFAAPPLAKTLRGCRVVTEPAVAASASDHLR